MQEKNRDISLLKQRISHFLDLKGETKAEFYKKTGISNGVLSQSNGLSEDNIMRFLSSYRDINTEWLLKGEGSILVGEKNTPVDYIAEPLAIFNKKERPKDIQRVPLYRIEAVAGAVPVFESLQTQTPQGYITIPNLPPCDGAIYMTGDSMYPLLKAGDILCFKVLNNLESIFWGEMYILSIVHEGDTYITVKYVQRSETKGNIKLVSENRHHQEKEMPIVAVQKAAHVVASIRINSIY